MPARCHLVVQTRLDPRHKCHVGEGPFNAWMERMRGETRTVSFAYGGIRRADRYCGALTPLPLPGNLRGTEVLLWNQCRAWKRAPLLPNGPSKLARFSLQGEVWIYPQLRASTEHILIVRSSDIQMILPSLLLLPQGGGLVGFPTAHVERPQLHRWGSVSIGNQLGRPLFMFPSFPIAHRIHARRPCNGCNPIRP